VQMRRQPFCFPIYHARPQDCKCTTFPPFACVSPSFLCLTLQVHGRTALCSNPMRLPTPFPPFSRRVTPDFTRFQAGAALRLQTSPRRPSGCPEDVSDLLCPPPSSIFLLRFWFFRTGRATLWERAIFCHPPSIILSLLHALLSPWHRPL